MQPFFDIIQNTRNKTRLESPRDTLCLFAAVFSEMERKDSRNFDFPNVHQSKHP